MQATVTPASMHAVIVTSERGGLMAPQERRAALDFEVKNQKARRLQKTADLQEQHRIEVMRTRHPDGVLGVDSRERVWPLYLQEPHGTPRALRPVQLQRVLPDDRPPARYLRQAQRMGEAHARCAGR